MLFARSGGHDTQLVSARRSSALNVSTAHLHNERVTPQPCASKTGNGGVMRASPASLACTMTHATQARDARCEELVKKSSDIQK
jgi:hypothetical protein